MKEVEITPSGYVADDSWREVADLDDAERRRLLADAWDAGNIDGQQDDVSDADGFIADLSAWEAVHFERALNDSFTEAMRLAYRSGYRAGRR